MFFLGDLPTAAMLDGYARRFETMDAPTVAEALGRLRWASLLMRDLEAYFAAHGLGQTQFLILIVIDREPERTSLAPSEIAARLDVSRPIVSNATRRLVERGLLAPAGTPAAPGRARPDARVRPLALTTGGRARLDALLPGYFRLIGEHMARPLPGPTVVQGA
ncbi:MAG: MarR family transcriptional regulator [Pseudomonadota bacterium]